MRSRMYPVNGKAMLGHCWRGRLENIDTIVDLANRDKRKKIRRKSKKLLRKGETTLD